jgi:cytidylate kinase
MARFFADRVNTDKRFEGYPFVTISRQAGAGGNSLAKALLERIQLKSYADPYRGWRIFDKEIAEILHQDKGLARSTRSLLAEEYHSEVEEFFKGLVGGPMDQYKLEKSTFALIRTLASIGKVILVGRAGASATRDVPGGVRVRLQAPIRWRIENMMSLMSLGRPEAEDLVKRQDHERARLARDFFDQDVDDPRLYDLVIDASQTPIADAGEKVFALLETRVKA